MVIDLLYGLPLTLISATCLFAIVLSAILKNNSKVVFAFSIVGLALTLVAALFPFKHGVLFQGMVRVGVLPSFFDIMFCGAALLTMIVGRAYYQRLNAEHDEMYLMILLATSGMMLMAHANHVLTFFIGIEIMSVSFYVLSASLRHHAGSVESGLKYFLMGAFATGFLLYGIALIYGATGGEMEYTAIRLAVSRTTMPMVLMAGTGLLIIGLCFKIAAFPFHLWAPDVYQGAPTTITAFMSTAGKAAAFSAFLAFMNVVIPEGTPEANKVYMLLAALAALSMLFGNITAAAQSNIKRMLAYSSVAQAGYMMMALVAGSKLGQAGLMLYIASYLFTQIGALIIVSLLEEHYGENLEFSDYAGLSASHPVLAGLLSLFMFSLLGIPPLAMFFGKYYLFMASIQAGFTWLTIIAAISTVISAYFYLGLIVTMYFKSAPEGSAPPKALESGLVGFPLIVSLFGVILLGIAPTLILQFAGL